MNYYKQSTLYPSIVSFIIGFAIAVIDNYDYKSEWIPADLAIAMVTVWVMVLCMYFAMLNIGLLVVPIDSIRTNRAKSVLAWFLLPTIGTVVLVLLVEFQWIIDWLLFAGVVLPFWVGLVLSYRKMRSEK
ncbi:hypothetical protein KFE98_20945 [bacterium SCSIO 12741]|nr:hypothetical protein KFE98_20945 [bacterium SCSIO 12741]